MNRMTSAFIAMLKEMQLLHSWRSASAPGWSGQHYSRNGRPRMRTRAGQSTRDRSPGPNTMQVEEFVDKDQRDARYRELRARPHAKHINKFSTVRPVNPKSKNAYAIHQSIWCVVHP